MPMCQLGEKSQVDWYLVCSLETPAPAALRDIRDGPPEQQDLRDSLVNKTVFVVYKVTVKSLALITDAYHFG